MIIKGRRHSLQHKGFPIQIPFKLSYLNVSPYAIAELQVKSLGWSGFLKVPVGNSLHPPRLMFSQSGLKLSRDTLGDHQ
jgi:hypothetical protein